MRYLVLIYDEETANPSPAPPDPEQWARTMGEYNDYTALLRLSEDALDRSLVEHLRCVESAADHSSSR